MCKVRWYIFIFHSLAFFLFILLPLLRLSHIQFQGNLLLVVSTWHENNNFFLSFKYTHSIRLQTGGRKFSSFSAIHSGRFVRWTMVGGKRERRKTREYTRESEMNYKLKEINLVSTSWHCDCWSSTHSHLHLHLYTLSALVAMEKWGQVTVKRTSVQLSRQLCCLSRQHLQSICIFISIVIIICLCEGHDEAIYFAFLSSFVVSFFFASPLDHFVNMDCTRREKERGRAQKLLPQ